MTTCAHIVLPLVFAVANPVIAPAQASDTLYLDPDGVMVVGEVLDIMTQRGLSVAEVRLLTPEPGGAIAWRELSDSVGLFRTRRLLAGDYRVEVSALGYTTASGTLVLAGHGSVDLRVELAPEAIRLDPILVTAARPSRLERNGFYERRDRGLGRSVTRTEMLARGLIRIENVFRMLPGVSVIPRAGGGSFLRMRGGCQPDVVIDGVRLGPVPRIEDVLSVESVEGIEVFGPGATPVQYSRSNCGVVLAWSREPGAEGGTSLSWWSVAAAVGFAALVLLISN